MDFGKKRKDKIVRNRMKKIKWLGGISKESRTLSETLNKGKDNLISDIIREKEQQYMKIFRMGEEEEQRESRL